ncbi:hypothetical protein SKAU_G00130690 [Synaphobranchus kaupii]|uniref:Uncharacterized protein n=1 Tax=Synaphobranchus kaupii TaxID=118154 RepID=A0A9Q1FRC5_SYNKA|nr:hypothetical protein SKAU_G00130690 [Synaphobranchus kaupii]
MGHDRSAGTTLAASWPTREVWTGPQEGTGLMKDISAATSAGFGAFCRLTCQEPALASRSPHSDPRAVLRRVPNHTRSPTPSFRLHAVPSLPTASYVTALSIALAQQAPRRKSLYGFRKQDAYQRGANASSRAALSQHRSDKGEDHGSLHTGHMHRPC